MATASSNSGRSFPWRALDWGFLLLPLLIPAIAMQFTDEVRWDAWDFIVLGAMLITLGAAIKLIVAKISRPTFRRLAIVGAILAFFAVWAWLAVGPG